MTMSRDDDNRDHYDRRSWSERDKRKGRSSHVREERRPGGERARRQREQAMSKYKADLERLFEGGKASKALQQVAPGLAKTGKDERSKLLRQIREELDPRKLAAAVKRYLDSYELPRDLEVLSRVIDHPDERVVLKALRRIEETISDPAATGAVSGRASLVQRLNTLQIISDDEEITELAGAIIERLR